MAMVIRPTIMVVFLRECLWNMACAANPALYKLVIAVVHPATITMTNPDYPKA